MGEVKIAVVGRRKVGKSYLVDRIINQESSNFNQSVDSNVEPLIKSVKLLPSGPSVIMSVASIESEESQGVGKTNKCLKAIINAVFTIIVLDARQELDNSETFLITYLLEKGIPFLIAVNKIEFGTNPHLLIELDALEVVYFEISCKENAGIESMKKKIIHLLTK